MMDDQLYHPEWDLDELDSLSHETNPIEILEQEASRHQPEERMRDRCQSSELRLETGLTSVPLEM